MLLFSILQLFLLGLFLSYRYQGLGFNLLILPEAYWLIILRVHAT